MEHVETGVTEHYIGIPTDDEREQLKEQGYTLMSNGKNEYEEYEIWLK